MISSLVISDLLMLLFAKKSAFVEIGKKERKNSRIQLLKARFMITPNIKDIYHVCSLCDNYRRTSTLKDKILFIMFNFFDDLNNDVTVALCRFTPTSKHFSIKL